MKEFFSNFLKGITIGSGAIIPGVSSGVFCVIFGIYEKLLDSILNFFSDMKKNTIFLFPLLSGSIVGILFFSKIINYSLFRFPIQTKSIFIGLILGCLPSLIKEINKKNNTNKESPKMLNFRLSNSFFLIFAFIIGVSCIFLETHLQRYNFYLSNTSSIYLIVCGFLMSIGIVVPGVSSTIILMLLGIYNYYILSVSNLYLPVLIPLGIGILIGCFIFMKLTQYFLKTYYIQTFNTIIGFTIGSIFVLLPEISSFIDYIIGFLCFVLRLVFINKFM